jgi:hypothetical protein
MHQLHELHELEFNSENFLIWEEENYPQTGCVALHLTGQCDDHALDTALFRAMDKEPCFHAHLDLVWRGGRHLFLWRFASQRPRLEVYDHTSAPAPKQISRWFYDRMQPLLERNMNLATEFPIRLQMHHLSANQHLFMFIFHHVVTDAARVFDFLRETFVAYHTLVKSVEPPWASAAALHAVVNRITLTLEPWLRYITGPVRDALPYPSSRIAVLAGDGNGIAKRTIRHVEIADETLLSAMKNRARRDGGGLFDLLIAAFDLTVEEWNHQRGIASDVMRNFLVVNQRRRQSDEWVAAHVNHMGTLPILLGKPDRTTRDVLLKTIIERRKSGLARGLDIRFMNEIVRIGGLARRLSFATRRKLLYPLVTMRNTGFLSNAGIIWPNLDAQGNPTGDSALIEFGDLEVLDAYMSLGCVRTWPLWLVIQSFRRKLYLEFLSGGNLFTEQNVTDFNELLSRKIADYL